MSQANNHHITNTPTPSLASLVHRYWEEVDADPVLDEDGNVCGLARVTMSEMVGVPVETGEDALAALDFLVADGVDLGQKYDPLYLTEGDRLGAVTTSLVHALREHLAGNAA
jgi:hypothetical protein